MFHKTFVELEPCLLVTLKYEPFAVFQAQNMKKKHNTVSVATQLENKTRTLLAVTDSEIIARGP